MARGREEEDRSAAAVELPSRLVFSLLQAAVRVAARVHFPLNRMQDLLRTAYFLEYRRRHPRDLATVAEKLGVSLRTAGTLNRSLKDAFFSPETQVEPIRLIMEALVREPRTVEQLEAITGLDRADVERALKHLTEVDWVHAEDATHYTYTGTLRSYVTEDLQKRVHGVNHQLSMIADSVWARFVKGDDQTAGARSWSFAARPGDVADALGRTFDQLRSEAIELANAGVEQEDARRFGITVAFAPLEEEE